MVTISESKNITRRKDFMYTVRISISASRLSIQTECRSSSGWAKQNRTSVAARDSKVTIEICSLFRSRVDRDSFVNRERTKILNLSRNAFHTRPLFREVGGDVDSNLNQSVYSINRRRNEEVRSDNEPEKQAHQRDWTRWRKITKGDEETRDKWRKLGWTYESDEKNNSRHRITQQHYVYCSTPNDIDVTHYNRIYGILF